MFRFPSLRRQILDAACAVGVSSTFAAPVGGVLFSIEVWCRPESAPHPTYWFIKNKTQKIHTQATTNYFELSNLWKSFMAAVGGFAVTRTIASFRGA